MSHSHPHNILNTLQQLINYNQHDHHLNSMLQDNHLYCLCNPLYSQHQLLNQQPFKRSLHNQTCTKPYQTTLPTSTKTENQRTSMPKPYSHSAQKSQLAVLGKHYKVPWLNDHIVKRAKAKRRKAKVNLNRTGLLADKLLHIQACNDYDSAVTRAKFRHETNLARHVNDNPKRFYNYAKTFTKSNCAINCLIKDDIKYVEDKHMANILNEHFVSVMTADTSNPPA